MTCCEITGKTKADNLATKGKQQRVAAAAASSATRSQADGEGQSTGYLRSHHHHHGGRHYHHEAGLKTSLRRRNVNPAIQHNASANTVLDSAMSNTHNHDQGRGHDHDHEGKEPISCCGGPSCGSAGDDKPYKPIDIEKAVDHELVSVSISGMDCTSCGDKLTRVLLMTKGVSQAQVNFIAGRADFTVNTSVAPIDQVVRLASSGSGFTLTRIIGGNYYLDVLVSPQAAKDISRENHLGVTDVNALDKTSFRITYDPATIGARDLFRGLGERVQGLAPPRNDPQLENSRRRLRDQLVKTCASAACTIPVVVLSWGNNLADDKTKAIVSLVLGTLVQAIAVPEFYRPALATLWYTHVVEMDMLVVISITAAFTYSVVAFGFQMAGRALDTSEFFETSTLLITLILLGRLIATLARVRAVAAVSLRSLQTNNAVLSEKGVDREIDARLLQYGDKFKVLPHSRIPTDGTVISGSTEIDESMLTGESLPVLKQVNDHVVAGTLNGDGTVLVQLDRLPGKNTVTDIAQLVDEAANSKPKIQDLANKVAGWFVPIVSSIALAVLVIWLAVGFKLLNYTTDKAIVEAITYFVATLAVACPCAVGLAVPMVLIVAGGLAARQGIIIKSAETVERARKVTDVIFDKTGTITESDLVVMREEHFSDEIYSNSITKALVAGGKHPVSAAVAKHLEGTAVSHAVCASISDIRVVPGAGIEGQLGEKTIRAGNPRWSCTETNPGIARLELDGLTTLVVAIEGIPIAVFGLRAQIRPEALFVIAELRARDIEVHLVSGDQSLAVEAVADDVGIPSQNVASERTPAQKQEYVASLMEDPGRHVMFCGDGTNDAVAVAQANVGVQIGGSLTTSDVTQSAADAVLLNGLEGVPLIIKISQAAFNRMAFNFAWSAVYNVLAITMASGAWVKFRIPPAYAGLGEFISVLPVIIAPMTMFLHKAKPASTQKRTN
jgi:Cu2+-exporting ATPase